MKIDWKIVPNVGPGIYRHTKPDSLKGTQRLTFKLTKKQQMILSVYCQDTGKSLSEVIREALTLYFDQSDWVQPVENKGDENQLKIF